VFNDANGFDGTINLVGSVATLTITTALTTGSVGFIGASGALLQDNANFFWDDTNNKLGLGTNAPTTALDVFGSGIIGRINGTSTNNAYLGFASAGTNKWSVGNVQSDHRFRIFSEATTSELFTILPTGEIGIGIANPFANLHIDGGASVNRVIMDANINVAKIFSFRSDNSPRWAFRVDGTESGSNAGADFAIRRYTDAGAFIDAPLSITRSTGAAIFSGTISMGNTLTIGNQGGVDTTVITGGSGFGSKIQLNTGVGIGALITGNTDSYVNATTGNFGVGQTSPTFKLDVSGTGRFTSNLQVGNQTANATLKIYADAGGGDGYLKFNADSDQTKAQIYGHKFAGTGGVLEFATLKSSVLTTAMVIDQNSNVGIGTSSPSQLLEVNVTAQSDGIKIISSSSKPTLRFYSTQSNAANRNWAINPNGQVFGDLEICTSAAQNGDPTASNRIVNMIIFPTGNITMGTIYDLGYELNLYSPDLANTKGTLSMRNGANNAGGYFVIFQNNSGGTAGVISQTGATTINYGASSDYRLKEDLKEFTGLDKISAIKVYDFKWIDEDLRAYGTMAHELQEIIPTAVTGNKDEMNSDGTIKTQQVDYSKLVPVLIKAIQELKEEINLLKGK
jgi:hypothetical protein